VRRLFRYLAKQEGLNVWVNMDNPGALNQSVDRGASGTVMLYAIGPASLDAKSEHDRRRMPGEKTVVFVRDPKDALVSQYWSWRNTHVRNTDEMDRTRRVLQGIGLQEGLAYLIEEDLVSFCHGIRPWYADLSDDDLRIARYESLLAGFPREMRAALTHLGLPVRAGVVRRMEHRHSFRSTTKGRAPGDEDTSSPLRKGVEGDWINYFDAELARQFDDAYGDVCDRLGYGRAGEGPSSRPVRSRTRDE
jgi:lipopolysaccharide transport system ATP-binding protein